MYLAGNEAPESWVWERLRYVPDVEASQLGTNPRDLSELMNRLDAIYDSASDSSSEIAKSKLRSLADALRGKESEICRILARLEVSRKDRDIQPLVENLK